MKIKVALLENDVNYLQRISSAFTNKFAEKVEMYLFTDVETAMESIVDNAIDVFLAGKNFRLELDKLPAKCGFAYLVDSNDIDMLNGKATVGKFQKAELIYKKILSIYSENASNISKSFINENVNTKIIYITSVSGGTGSSTVASACAKTLAKYGRRVLYLNLETIPSTNIFFKSDGTATFSDIIYAIKSKYPNLSLKIESTVVKDESGVNFFKPCEVMLDMMELKREDIETLISAIQLSDDYDYVIIDGEFSLEEDKFAIIDKSNLCILVTDGTDVANNKFIKTIEAMKIVEKKYNSVLSSRIAIIHNRFSDRYSTVLEGYDFTVLGGANRIVASSSREIADELMTKNLFDRLF